MTTVEDIARQVIADVASDAGHVLAAQWVAERYTELCSKVRYRHLRKLGEVTVPHTVTDGTVTLTQGSTQVVPDATALAAWQALSGSVQALIGRSLRSQTNQWWLIDAVDPVTGTLELQTPWLNASVAGAGYFIAARAVSLDPNARWIAQTMVDGVRNWRIPNLSLDELDLSDPQRLRPLAPVQIWTQTETAPDGTLRCEFYPYPQADEMLNYVFWSIPLTLDFDDPIPTAIDGYVLKEGAIIDAMRYEASKAARAGKMEQAAYWRNEYRAQETLWQNKMRDAARTDRGVDDVSFILHMTGRRNWAVGDITNAHQQVWSTWGSL